MTRFLDAVTEKERERVLMQRVRDQAIAPGELESAMLPFPLKIQIQTSSPCSAACVMCPWPLTRDELPQGRMSEELYLRVVEQIAGRGVERAGLFLMNEPLLDKRLARLTRLLKERDPKIETVIYTNGELLDGERAQALADAGMDEIDVSVVGFDRASYESIMRDIDYERVMANLDEVGALLRAGKLGRMQLRVVGLDFPEAVQGMQAFQERSGIDVLLKPVTNRAGLIDVDSLGAAPARPEFRACQRPFVKAYVLYNGDLVLCNCDWRRTTIVGNVAERPIEALWRDERLMEIRRAHLARALDPASLCAKCDYPYVE